MRDGWMDGFDSKAHRNGDDILTSMRWEKHHRGRAMMLHQSSSKEHREHDGTSTQVMAVHQTKIKHHTTNDLSNLNQNNAAQQWDVSSIQNITPYQDNFDVDSSKQTTRRNIGSRPRPRPRLTVARSKARRRFIQR